MTAPPMADVAPRPSDYPSRVAAEPLLLPRPDPVVWGTVDDGPLDEVALARFDTNGFLVLPDLLDAAGVARFLDEVERLAADPSLDGDERRIIEPGSGAVRSVFEVHVLSELFAELFASPAVVGPIRQLLGSDVEIFQSRVNRKPGFTGKEFYWHSDFETWHIEDGMPRPRAISLSLALTENRADNGSLMIIPGSHRTFVSCVGETPENHYRQSLRAQHYGVPDDESLAALAAEGGIETVTLPAGSGVLFDSNCMHGSNGNITPFGRCNAFTVFNSVENRLEEPFGGLPPRPRFLAAR